MKRNLIAISLIACVLLISLPAKAQYVLKLADEQYILFNYTKAVELYQQAYKKKPTLYTAEHLANSYRLMNDYQNAEKWYAITVTMPESKPENLLRYAEILKSNSKYTESKAQYTKYYILSPEIPQEQLDTWTASCDSCVKWMQDPRPFEIKNERALNSPKSDWGAVNFNNLVVFASDRGVKPTTTAVNDKKPFLKFDVNQMPDQKIYGWTGNSYLKLYQADAKSKTAVSLYPVIGLTDYHIGAASFTKDGNEMYFAITRIPGTWKPVKDSIETINLEIWSCTKNPSTNAWGKPVPFRYNNVSRWSVGDPFITPDGQMLYFVSNKPGGAGGTDIYYCIKDIATGNWAEPVNLKAVNTPGNERTPSFDEYGNLYFSSDAGLGMGGLDIFKAQRKGATFDTPQNMGYPVNSTYDDFAFNTTDGTTGYLSSNRAGGQGSDDIYSFAPRAPLALKLEGIAYLKNTTTPITNSTIMLTKANGQYVKVNTDEIGFYSFPLSEKTDYKLKGEKSGYLSDNQTLTTKGLIASQTIKKDVYLDKIILNKAIRIENIYYDFDKSSIRDDAAIELDKLIKILRDNPTIHIELGSHTDSRGNDEYNLALSQRRAKAAVEYIVKLGEIDANRVVAHGYGETQLLNRCANGVKCSEKEHQWNRRTEFKITSM